MIAGRGRHARGATLSHQRARSGRRLPLLRESGGAREGLMGWVRNLPDGRVETDGEGEAEAMERFERAVRQGPPGARVDEVEIDDHGPVSANRISESDNWICSRRRFATFRIFPRPGSFSTTSRRCCRIREGFRAAIDSLAVPFTGQGIDLVVGIESRGFIFGAAVADRIGAGFTPVRKPGKLPSTTMQRELLARVRHRHARNPRRCGRERASAC